MTDPTEPLRALRTPIEPVDPDPGFAAALRARIERALLAPEGEAMTTTISTEPTRALRATDVLRLQTLTPYLAVADARREIAFYETAFGAVLRGEPVVMPDGRIGHAALSLGDSVLMLAEEFPELDLRAPATRGGPSQSVRLEVADPDAVVAAALAAGGALDRPVTDSPYGRGGVVLDPSGHRWMVAQQTPTPWPGDLAYASIWTPDVAAADRFYTAVLGWTLADTREGRGRQVSGAGMSMGMWGGQSQPTLMPCWVVDDVDDAVELARAAGGTAEAAVDEAYGRVAQCADDQGQPFAVFTPPADGGGHGGGATGGPGELTYYELRSPDPARARAFYSTVLGWRFRPGTEPGYWHPLAGDRWPRPSCGLVRGERAETVPWFRVADLDAAVAAVRAGGGTAAEPEQSRDGLVAVCTDDQGARFCLTR